jgi:hypothetical protein
MSPWGKGPLPSLFQDQWSPGSLLGIAITGQNRENSWRDAGTPETFKDLYGPGVGREEALSIRKSKES